MTREEALNILHNASVYHPDYLDALNMALKALEQEPKTGHWEMCEDADGIYGVCDICGTDADFTHYGEAYPYCPNCGAKMVELKIKIE